jgi:hypothetical protein
LWSVQEDKLNYVDCVDDDDGNDDDNNDNVADNGNDKWQQPQLWSWDKKIDNDNDNIMLHCVSADVIWRFSRWEMRSKKWKFMLVINTILKY